MRRAIACQLVALTGCSLFVSLDGLSDGDASAPTSDASADANASDVIARDVAVNEASTPDGGDAAAACTGFCDDFDDRVSPVVGQWDSQSTLGGASATNMDITTAEFVSAPSSLHLHIPARSSGGTDQLFLQKTWPLSAGAMSVDFDVKIVGDTSGFDGYANLMELNVGGFYSGSFTAGSGSTVIDYWVNFDDGGHYQPLFKTNDDANSGWHHVHYAVTYDLSAAGSFAATFDATSLANLSGIQTYGNGAVPATFTVSLGYSSSPALPSFDVYFDNVQVE